MLSKTSLGNTITKSLIAKRLNSTIAESISAAEKQPELSSDQVNAIDNNLL